MADEIVPFQINRCSLMFESKGATAAGKDFSGKLDWQWQPNCPDYWAPKQSNKPVFPDKISMPGFLSAGSRYWQL